MVLVDWVLQESGGLWGLNLGVELNEGHSNLSSGVSAAAEAEVLNDIVLWVGRVEDLLIVGVVTVAKVLAWLLIGVEVLGFGLEGGSQLQVGSLAQLLLLLGSGSDGGASRARETMVLNDIIIMVGLSLKVSVLHGVTVGDLVTWLVEIELLLLWLGIEHQVSLSIDVGEHLWLLLNLFSGDGSQECDNSKSDFHF